MYFHFRAQHAKKYWKFQRIKFPLKNSEEAYLYLPPRWRWGYRNLLFLKYYNALKWEKDITETLWNIFVE